MLSKNIQSLSSTALKRYLASHATAAKSARNDQLEVTNLPSGITIASNDNGQAISRLCISVRAGARYEPLDKLGLTHSLRSAAGLATERYTAFGITRNIEYFGGRLSVVGGRDTLTYLLEAQCDTEVLEKNVRMLFDTIARPAFKHWELADNLERMQAEVSILNDSPYIQLGEAIHAVSFKGGLRNSLYCPEFAIGKHKQEDLLDYVSKRFVSKNTVVVGMGIEHARLLELVGEDLQLPGTSAEKSPSKFIGGELHVNSNADVNYVAVAAEGVGLNNPKQVAAAYLLQVILGNGPQIKNAHGLSQVTRLGKALANVVGTSSTVDAAVTAFNLNYEDTGLFGINLVASTKLDAKALTKTVVKEFRSAANSITDAEVASAKNNLKTSIAIGLDDPAALSQELASQLLFNGAHLPGEEQAKLVDSITTADVKALAGKLTKSKIALATVGQDVPYLDDLLE